jgi:hypothetical protein
VLVVDIENPYSILLSDVFKVKLTDLFEAATGIQGNKWAPKGIRL